MTIMNLKMPTIARTGKDSKYDLIFANLQAGTDQCHVETDFVDAKKMAGRMNGAISAYRARSGDKAAFAVRIVDLEGDKQVVGVWKLDKEFTPRAK
jgi:hypothetical protein